MCKKYFKLKCGYNYKRSTLPSVSKKIMVRLGLLIILKVTLAPLANAVDIDVLQCGVDMRGKVETGRVELSDYPWLGVLYYEYMADRGVNRAVTTVVLIQAEFVLAPGADVGPMPKEDFTANVRILLGHGWEREGVRARSYVLHPEYEQSRHTVALVQLARPIRTPKLRPACPPPMKLRDPEFYIMRFDDDYESLRKEVMLADYVPSRLCKSFYEETKLYARSMRPPHVACAISLEHKNYCLWETSGALVTRDVWGRWQLLGLGVRGPGCSAPSRYMDIASYMPWIEQSFALYDRVTISRVTPHKYVLRSDHHYMQRYGDCVPEEMKRILYRDRLILKKYTRSTLFEGIQYNMTLRQAVRFTCLTMELINASSRSEIIVRHTCPKAKSGGCYEFKDSVFDLAVFLIYGKSCVFEMVAYGHPISMTLIDKQVWKWEEGSYYPDFSLTRTEYRGTAQQTGFGYDPLDESMWVPQYDIWTTTPKPNVTTMKPTSPPIKYPNMLDEYNTGVYYNTWLWNKMVAHLNKFEETDSPMIPRPPPPTRPMPTTSTTTTTTTKATPSTTTTTRKTRRKVTTQPTTRPTKKTTTTKKKTTSRTTGTKRTRKTKTRTTSTPKTTTRKTTTTTTPTTTLGRWYG